MCQVLSKLITHEVLWSHYNCPTITDKETEAQRDERTCQAYRYCGWQSRDLNAKGHALSVPLTRLGVVVGMKTSGAVWPCCRLWGNSSVSILMFPLKSYPLAERPGRWQMSPLSRHLSQVINSHSGFGMLSLLREEGWLCLVQFHPLTWLPLGANGKMYFL